MDYTPRINQAIADCFRDGYGEDREWLETSVRQTALGGDDLLWRQLKDYTDAAIDLALMIQEALDA